VVSTRQVNVYNYGMLGAEVNLRCLNAALPEEMPVHLFVIEGVNMSQTSLERDQVGVQLLCQLSLSLSLMPGERLLPPWSRAADSTSLHSYERALKCALQLYICVRTVAYLPTSGAHAGLGNPRYLLATSLNSGAASALASELSCLPCCAISGQLLPAQPAQISLRHLYDLVVQEVVGLALYLLVHSVPYVVKLVSSFTAGPFYALHAPSRFDHIQHRQIPSGCTRTL
jgi:hypothetical protein